MGALAASLIPAAVGLALIGLVGPLGRRFGAATAAAFATRAALGSAVLVGLLLAQWFQREAAVALRFAWVHVGRTTRLDWLVYADPLALLLGAVALLGLALAPIAALGQGSAAARATARSALACGAALLLATAGTLWQAGIAVALVGLAFQTWPSVQDLRDMPGRSWSIDLVAAGLATAGLAWLVGAGDLELATLQRTAFGQGGSSLVRARVGGPLAGLSPALVGAAAMTVAALAWLSAWPRLLARAWADGPTAAAGAALVLPALPVVLTRTMMPLALAPTTLAPLTTMAAATAAWGGWRAARAASRPGQIAAIGMVMAAVATAAIGVGDLVASTRLLTGGALWLAALVLALAGGRRATLAVAAIGGLGPLVGFGEAVAGLWARMSAWTSGINVVAPALALAAIAGAAVGLRRVLAGRSEETGWPAPEAGPLLVGAAAVLALAAAAVGLAPLASWFGPMFLGGALLEGAYALGLRPGASGVAWIGVALVGAAAIAGVLLSGRVRAAGSRGSVRRRGALVRPLAAVEAGLRRVVLWPGDERVIAAPRGRASQAALLGVAAAAAAILGTVYCNPDVVVLGPTRVHPVDLGGLDAAMAGARRAAPVEAERAEGMAEGAGGAAEAGGADARGGAAVGGSGMAEGAGGGGADARDGAAVGGAGMAEGAGGAAEAGGASAAGAGEMAEGAGPRGQVLQDSREGGP